MAIVGHRPTTDASAGFVRAHNRPGQRQEGDGASFARHANFVSVHDRSGVPFRFPPEKQDDALPHIQSRVFIEATCGVRDPVTYEHDWRCHVDGRGIQDRQVICSKMGNDCGGT